MEGVRGRMRETARERERELELFIVHRPLAIIQTKGVGVGVGGRVAWNQAN